MKTKQTFTLLAILAVLLSSCKKSGSNTEETPVKKLKYLSQLKTTGADNITTTANYTYDEQKRISKVVNGGNTITYAYNGDQIFEIESTTASSGFRDVMEFTFATDKTISKVRKRIYRNNSLNSDVNYNFYYTAGRITQIKHDIYTDTYTYDSRGNVTKAFFDEFNAGNDYTYDEKPRTTTNGFPKYVITSEVQNASPNNQITRPGTTTTYTYDADGYPTNATAVNPSGTTKYAYIYTEL